MKEVKRLKPAGMKDLRITGGLRLNMNIKYQVKPKQCSTLEI